MLNRAPDGEMSNGTKPLETLFDAELQAIEERRKHVLAADEHQAWKESSTSAEKLNANQALGLAFSGGGIRSATFSLGVIQALAELRQLRRVDYLSTVSGGGYIGAWLLGLFKRLEGVTDDATTNFDVAKKFEQSLRPPVSPLGELDIQASARPEHSAIRWLRQYSNYLAPRPALFSADVWNIVAIWLRNALLNQVVLAALLGAVLLAVRFGADLFQRMPGRQSSVSNFCFFLAAAIFLTTIFLLCRRVRTLVTSRETKNSSEKLGSSGQSPAVWMALGLYLSALVASISIWNVEHRPDMMLRWAAGSVVFAGSFLAAGFSVQWKDISRKWLVALRLLLATVVATLVFLLVSIGIGWAFLENWVYRIDGQYRALIWGPCIILSSFGLQVILMLGLMGTTISDFVREWWSRLGAWLTILASVPTAIALIAVYGPPVVMWIWTTTVALKATVSATWIVTTLIGVSGAFSGRTNGGEGRSNKLLEWIVPLAPPVFMLGLLLLVAIGIDEGMHGAAKHWPWAGAEQICIDPALRNTNLYDVADLKKLELQPRNPSESVIITSYFQRLGAQPWWLHALGILVLGGIVFGMGAAVDINQFSMHNFYRNRLVRAYLGASRRRPWVSGKMPARDADRFTNFDPDDDIPLHDLQSERGRLFLGPVSIVNGALNLATPDAGKQERRASSFTFGPFYCGYDAIDENEQMRYFYRSSRPAKDKSYEAVTLGHAMTVSGAAASPNMGYHSSMPLAFLMTVFNVRLGWWFPNPAKIKQDWGNSGPRFGLFALISELFAQADLHSKSIYVSDGGHFENLGVYELLRRRCRYILCVDAEEDGSFSFGGLGSLIRKARADFGIEIEIDTSAISELDAKGHSRRHCASASIWYPEPGLRGTLLYIKSSVTGDEPGDILQYQQAQPLFPHETTGDQFFSESQMESYRRLGYHALIETFRPAQSRDGTLPALHETFLRLRQAWGTTPRFSAAQFTGLTERLDRLIETLGTDADLAFLHSQFYYPQWGQIRRTSKINWPLDEKIFQRAFFFCISLLQIMEDVYLELDLESHHDHPDCSGWMNQFRQWAASDMFRITNAIAGATFGERFQSFVRRHLDLKPGEVAVDPEREYRPDSYAFNEVEIGIQNALAEYFKGETLQFRPIWIDIAPVLPEEMPKIPDRIRLTVGFYVLDTQGRLRWMRVQNHLRRMGIAREALTQLCTHDVTLGKVPTKNEVWWETDSARHIRWVNSVMTLA